MGFAGCQGFDPLRPITKFCHITDPTTLWWTNIAMENHHFNGKIHYKWPFSIAMLVHQRVPDPTNLSQVSVRVQRCSTYLNSALCQWSVNSHWTARFREVPCPTGMNRNLWCHSNQLSRDLWMFIDVHLLVRFTLGMDGLLGVAGMKNI